MVHVRSDEVAADAVGSARHTGQPAPEVSVVIPTHRQPHCLGPVLDSLNRQTIDRDLFEVVVIEDPSEVSYEGVAEQARSLGFRFDTLPTHAGRGAARNRALELVTGEVVLFLDGDSYAAPDLVERHWRFHRDNELPRVLIGTRLEVSLAFAGRLTRGEQVSADEARRMYYDIRFHPDAPAEYVRLALQTPWMYSYTNNISLPRSLLSELGGFDDEFGTQWGFEDIELFYRVYVHLGRPPEAFSYDGAAVVYHLPHYRDSDREDVEWRSNDLVFKRKHPHFETELGVKVPAIAGGKARLYRNRIASFVGAGIGCVDEPTWRALEPVLQRSDPARTVFAGCGTEQLPLAGTTITIDHGLAPSARNHHLLLIDTAFPDKTFDTIVNVDLWRLLTWDDLCRHVGECLRIADQLVLVHNDSGEPAYDGLGTDVLVTRGDLDYLARALEPHASVLVDRTPPSASMVYVSKR